MGEHICEGRGRGGGPVARHGHEQLGGRLDPDVDGEGSVLGVVNGGLYRDEALEGGVAAEGGAEAAVGDRGRAVGGNTREGQWVLCDGSLGDVIGAAAGEDRAFYIVALCC
jgi:hypothetical protein